MKLIQLMLVVGCLTILNACTQKTQLIVRADDMGVCNAVNEACVEGYRYGIITSVEVLVNGPKFYEAAKLLAANKGLDVGVHLCLTNEWKNIKWGAITDAPSLLADGNYFATTNDELFGLDLNIDELRTELKAQIDTAIKNIPQVSHLSTHMFASHQDKRIRKVIDDLSDEYKLPVRIFDSHYHNFFNIEPEKKEDALAKYIGKMQPGLNIFVLHPGYDNEETQAIVGEGCDSNVRMAEHRQAVTNAVLSDRIKKLILKNEIELVSYADVCNF